ncbi:MAG: 3-keto-disaccharide hydrolase [Planctomycetota bacterium]
MHDPDRPVPKVVVPRPVGSTLTAAPAPSDAIVLFDGKDTSHWKAPEWEVKDGTLLAGHGSLETKQPFGDCQLHLEFATPREASQRFMNRGNSGVIFMKKYELQIFDSWHEHSQHIYPDGQAAAIYGQTPPLVNACMPPGQWQSFDIVFTAPVFKDEKLVERPVVSMYHNGVLVHHKQPVMGEMSHRGIKPCAPHPAKLPLVLQGHGSAVRFRNIWIRELRIAASERLTAAW